MDGEHISESSGREFQRVADELRTRMIDGTYRKDTLLPPQRELADSFGVSRDTIQRVLKELKSEGWIETRQGSGSRVIKTQIIQSVRAGDRDGGMPTLSDLLSDAFEQQVVTLDVHTLTSEALDAHIRTQVARIASGTIAPQRISLRMLLPDEDLLFPYGRSRERAHDQQLRTRFLDITHRHIESLRTALDDLKSWKPELETSFELRHLKAVPTSKLYLFNGVEALHGFYEVRQRSIELDGGTEVDAIDVWGLGTTLTHHVMDEDDPGSPGSVFVRSAQEWFDSAWDLLTRESPWWSADG
ncbi:GntR family transcriptional regulator [Streptomyces sp. NPDC026672]|uniref:winged helix-turn-helix domain-containing protein n=1 Tax=unclassified Streptomyces TaxID=2593676 RepID=UPI003400658F